MSVTAIRKMQKSDIPAVVDMIHALNAFHDYEGKIDQASLERDTAANDPWFYVHVAEREGTLVVYMVLIRIAKIADGLRGLDINHMFVTGSARGTGVSRKLIGTAKEQARQMGCSYIMISTAPDNSAAQKAYNACGFDDFPTSDATRFRMEI